MEGKMEKLGKKMDKVQNKIGEEVQEIKEGVEDSLHDIKGEMVNIGENGRRLAERAKSKASSQLLKAKMSLESEKEK